ncbi:hypothetical protein CROQUDRAFT_41717 [Cronartium quercuum f. sp. fusiforme G11]|uniref:NAD(+) kinase n=1 Tax=Cronartium quercuum f. sp. fusiforme G11 TaxID=708437 RepID=A0A9P6TDW2_9BASI|nr:hypothetical protein CROQUDRAFT_41717 [Cronartium quercuum f. sp. fusiforme G11]
MASIFFNILPRLRPSSSPSIRFKSIPLFRSSHSVSSTLSATNLDPYVSCIKLVFSHSLTKPWGVFGTDNSIPASLRRFSNPSPFKKPRKVLIVKKPNDLRATTVLESLLSFIQNQEPLVELFVDHPDTRARRFVRGEHIDLVIALGGDGTVLHVASLFRQGECPDILGFNLGTIGFLLPFPVEGCEKVLKQVLDGKVKREERMRLSCVFRPSTQHSHPPDQSQTEADQIALSAVNEVSLHRSQHPHMTPIHISIDGQHLTTVVADGLVVSTPTGSTAYSCSAGGPIVHPAVDALLITPICPRSLSFRPLVVPADVRVELTLDSKARATAELALDGISSRIFHPGQSLLVGRSAYPIRLFSPGDGWIEDLNGMLNFNRSFASKTNGEIY